MTAHSMLLQASPEPASVPGGGTLGKLCQLAAAHQANLFSEAGRGAGCISTPVSQRSFLYFAFSKTACCQAVFVQGLTLDGYSAHPAALDACTHFGALYDTDPVTRGGLSQFARVPVALAALVAESAPQVHTVLCWPCRAAAPLLQSIADMQHTWHATAFSRAALAGTASACHVHEQCGSTWHRSGQLILTAGRIWGASNAPARPHLAPAALQVNKTFERWHSEPPQRLAV